MHFSFISSRFFFYAECIVLLQQTNETPSWGIVEVSSFQRRYPLHALKNEMAYSRINDFRAGLSGTPSLPHQNSAVTLQLTLQRCDPKVTAVLRP
jgi:hypothetical protein